ncbi:MAG: Polymorphic membrane protein [Candidatus Jorgensenbacteria bacterium GW2011_GWA1_48_13]|uniref:Polymorphic membrane protein n=2 Tax=Candidatus Joergenseniibacteriota TaxID=1752739 RepID=A0A0G1Z8R8_9BACT|nr:MAG: Polymorphic membrane protein [Candidatus Jorgensenbacteria bacterium GW2011_GWA1_48_13]KKU98506.1 MAG: Phospholipase D/competence protein ComEA helix-hairpin-helix domain protein [Candidatus Jorgensenbacteria bacterium GW2011_GWC1_48_8]KKW15429.1 MAG: Polymorphic membrane protein [Candidatus Jorgensenbacteria bacterium GW2011_GWB1_50_10]
MLFNFKVGFIALLGLILVFAASNFDSVADGSRKFLGEASGLFKETFFPQDNFREVAVIPLNSSVPGEEKNEPVEKELSAVAAVSRTVCDFDSGSAPVPDKIILNEIAWMGTAAGFDKEWIEIKNISDEPANISGFQILDRDEQIKIIFPKGAIIPAGGFYLLERGEEAVSQVKADLTYTGNLRNADEALEFFDGDCNLIDEASASPNWPAGDSKNKFTMERNADGNGWHASSVKDGTPKKENSSAAVIPISPIGNATTSETAVSPGDSSFQSPPLSPPEAFVAGKININTAGYEELQKITGVGPVIAGRIIDYRNVNGPFGQIEDIKDVKGIGDITFQKMQDEITI